jgi:hypothetical protein
MSDLIDKLRELSESVSTPLELPDEDLLVTIEEELLLGLPVEFRTFLLEVSDVVLGSLEPVTVADPNLHTHLPEVAAQAWAGGVSRELIPICESAGNYYCIAVDGVVTLCSAEGDSLEGEWPSIWDWVEEVWLQS